MNQEVMSRALPSLGVEWNLAGTGRIALTSFVLDHVILADPVAASEGELSKLP